MHDPKQADTGTHVTSPQPDLFQPHPSLSAEINENILRSEVEGGVHLDALEEGATLTIETRNRLYTVEYLGEGKALISGHPVFCPRPLQVRIEGSTWGGSMLKLRFIGRGMQLEFRHPTYLRITTSPIVDIRAMR